MTDIVERLRDVLYRAGPAGIRAPRIDISVKAVSDAADEIERLREALDWALQCWDEHMKHGYTMQGDWVQSARAALGEGK